MLVLSVWFLWLVFSLYVHSSSISFSRRTSNFVWSSFLRIIWKQSSTLILFLFNIFTLQNFLFSSQYLKFAQSWSTIWHSGTVFLNSIHLTITSYREGASGEDTQSAYSEDVVQIQQGGAVCMGYEGGSGEGCEGDVQLQREGSPVESLVPRIFVVQAEIFQHYTCIQVEMYRLHYRGPANLYFFCFQ